MADTIRVLISTDNHVGYAERDPIRGDDSWKTFHEVMGIAKEQDVDMVLLGGDLFHDNLPSRKSMYNVMRSLRLNCYGDKPCELEFLSDGSEHFDSTIGHANYEDPDINVAIPVFSIHGNHDDPSGEGFYAALDILEMAGLINYFGRVPESDNITVKPLFFQKGQTKLALYGLSNVRDERLHRTFRDGKAKFMRPVTQQSDWFNLLCVHQNHHAHTETSYLPEAQLPEYMDLVVWGHEHECDPIAHKNPERGFRVLQPGSSVATSLIPGEAAPKQVFILTVTGRDFRLEPVRLKTVRPFVYKDVVLSAEKEAVKIAKKSEHRSALTRYLEGIVRNLIKQAQEDWLELQGPDYDPSDPEAIPMPLPLIRLRVETTSPDGGLTKFDVENPQRFSNRFTNEVANRNDVISCHARKKTASRKTLNDGTKLDAEIMSKFVDEEMSDIKVQNIVKEFLAAQSLTILPQNYFGEAVAHYIDKDDKHAMEHFVNQALSNQIKNLVKMHDDAEDEEDEEEGNLQTQIEHYRQILEDEFKKGKLKNYINDKRKFRPKPAGWDSDEDGSWIDQPGTLIRDDEDDEPAADDDDDDDDNDMTTVRTTTTTTRGRGRGRGRGTTAAASTRGKGRGAGKATSSSRGKKPIVEDSGSASNEDIVMIDDDEEDDSQAMFIPQKKTAATNGTRARGARAGSTTSGATRGRKAASPAPRKPPARTAAARAKQATLNFSASQASVLRNGRGASVEEEIEDDDDEDAFEPVSVTRSRRR